jgi:hypothetical protein
MYEQLAEGGRSTIVGERLTELRREADVERSLRVASRPRRPLGPIRLFVGRVLIGLGAAIVGPDDCEEQTAMVHAA